MAVEIEKKFLIKEGNSEYATQALRELYPSVKSLKEDVLAKGEPIRQGYMLVQKGIDLAHRVGLNVDFRVEESRLRNMVGKFYLTLKGSGDLARNQLESEIPKNLFDEYWPDTKGRRIEKTRLHKPYKDTVIEIDVFTDRDLIMAEVEVPTLKEAETLRPVGLDVTTRREYKNKNLAK